MDPRGSGRSSDPGVSYSTSDMAADAVAVLDQAHVDRAHIVSVGLGAMAAQHVAIQFGDRVETLTMFSTFAHCDAHAARLFETWRELLPIVGWETLGRTISLWTLTPRFFEQHPDELSELEASFREVTQSPEAYSRQVDALLAHDTRDQLHLIQAPTLVLLGADDIETPMRFASELAEGIPRGRLQILPETGHRPHVETPRQFNRAVLSFLEDPTAPPHTATEEAPHV